MNTENYCSQRLLAVAVRVKEAIDITFSYTIGTAPQMGNMNVAANPPPHKWKNAVAFALEFKVGRKELQKAFKYCNKGKGINEYQAEKKIEAACILLANGQLTIKEIAVELDYHQDYFSYLFKKQKGMTPTEWQKVYGNSN